MDREYEEEPIVTPERTKNILKKYNIEARRSLGQNFLTDRDVLASIVSAADLDPCDRVVEIGPGIGALTEALLEEMSGGRLLAVEKDERLAGILASELAGSSCLEIIEADALELNWDGLLPEKNFAVNGYKLLANLPYYITSPLIRLFLEMEYSPEMMVLMVQKEVAARIAASPGGKEYGVLSIAVQYYCYPEIIDFVPAAAFQPQPDVDSAVIRLNLSGEPRYDVKDEKLFFGLVRAMFQQRRKMLRNSLSGAAELDLSKKTVKRALKRADIDERLRGEKLSLAEIARLSDELHNILNGNGD